MNDIHDDVTELLRRRAADVPPHREVPRSMVGRARRRVAVNALAVAAAVVVVGVVAVVGVRAFSPATDEVPRRGPGTPSQAPNSMSMATECTAVQISAVASMEGAMGSREGAILFTNVSNDPCTLTGRPAINLLGANDQPVTADVSVVPTEPAWSVNRSPEPEDWPVVKVGPGGSASIRIRWSNWCPNGNSVPTWRIVLPGGGTVGVARMDVAAAPPCSGGGEPSTIEEGPFEPVAGP
jgi:hypothetical protein